MSPGLFRVKWQIGAQRVSMGKSGKWVIMHSAWNGPRAVMEPEVLLPSGTIALRIGSWITGKEVYLARGVPVLISDSTLDPLVLE